MTDWSIRKFSNNKADNQFGVILPDIRLRRDDAVTVTGAGGCVQTGGPGAPQKQWKKYGGEEGSPYGALGVINAEWARGPLGNPVPIRDVVALVPFWVPADQPLRLGYIVLPSGNDDYSNNGYWGAHDPNPSCGSSRALVTLQIQHNVPPFSFPVPEPWDLVTVDPAVSDPFDLNALLFNPRWAWQTSARDEFGPARFEDCAGTDLTLVEANTAHCTSVPVTTDRPDDFFKDLLSSCALGHANWTTVSYRGQLFWLNHDTEVDIKWPPVGDDDYNFHLKTPVTNGSESGATGNNPDIKLEFNASETIDHFVTPFWVSFQQAVDKDIEPHVLIEGKDGKGKEAIVIGLMGLDLVSHSDNLPTTHPEPKSEIHPVFALAIHVNSDPRDDTWAVFARNYGNEGFCSSDTHYLDLQTLTLQLPRPSEDLAPLDARHILSRRPRSLPPTIQIQ